MGSIKKKQLRNLTADEIKRISKASGFKPDADALTFVRYLARFLHSFEARMTGKEFIYNNKLKANKKKNVELFFERCITEAEVDDML